MHAVARNRAAETEASALQGKTVRTAHGTYCAAGTKARALQGKRVRTQARALQGKRVRTRPGLRMFLRAQHYARKTCPAAAPSRQGSGHATVA